MDIRDHHTTAIVDRERAMPALETRSSAGRGTSRCWTRRADLSGADVVSRRCAVRVHRASRAGVASRRAAARASAEMLCARRLRSAGTRLRDLSIEGVMAGYCSAPSLSTVVLSLSAAFAPGSRHFHRCSPAGASSRGHGVPGSSSRYALTRTDADARDRVELHPSPWRGSWRLPRRSCPLTVLQTQR